MSKKSSASVTVSAPANDQPKVSKKELKAMKKSRPASGSIDHKTEQTSSGGNRMTIFGMSVCKILKWMGQNGWSKKDATLVVTHLCPTVSGSTIGCQFYSGRALASGNTPTHSGKSADLSKGQIAELEALKVKLTSTPAK